jgi:hypothetical protein
MTADTAPLLALARECADEHWSEITTRMGASEFFTLSERGIQKLAERIRQDERERAIKACAEEKVDAAASGDATDAAYNLAIDHCIAAIRSSGTSEGDANDSQ